MSNPNSVQHGPLAFTMTNGALGRNLIAVVESILGRPDDQEVIRRFYEALELGDVGSAMAWADELARRHARRRVF